MIDLIVSVIPMDESSSDTIGMHLCMTNWKAADDLSQGVVIRAWEKDGDRVRAGNGLLLTPGEAFLLSKALVEYFRKNALDEPERNRAAVICHASRTQDKE